MKRRGSITVFLAMLLTCFFSAVFAFLETARVSGLRADCKVSTMQAKDTVMASYDRLLWSKYHLMFWQVPEGDLPDLTTLKTLQQGAIEGNLARSGYLQDNYYVMQVHLADVATTSYELATDNAGAAFCQQAAEMMGRTVAEDAVSGIMEWINSADASDEGQGDLGDKAIEALEQLEEAKKAAAENAEAEGTGDGTAGESSDSGGESASPDLSGIEVKVNPLEWVKGIKSNGVLPLVMPQESISRKSIDTGGCIENRILQSGTLTFSSDETAAEKLLFRLYLDKYFTDATEEGDDHALSYELEYMIAGNAEDEENLKTVVRRLLLMKEGTNLVYLEANEEKRQEAAAVAALLSTAVGFPELEPVVQQGLLAAWAYAESISDVRILLEGGKVSVVKTEAQWHTDITDLATSVFSAGGSEQSEGLSYANYLQILMWTASGEDLAERAMDMIEKNTDLQMDQMLCRAECDYTYEASPLFWGFVTLGENSFDIYRFQDQSDISFLE